MHFPFTGEPSFCSPDTNGCAAGDSLPEAMLTAALELIERDAVAIWWYNRLRRPRIDLTQIGESHILDIQKEFAREGRDLYVLDLTNDLEIPVYVAIIPSSDGSKPYFGAAAHVSARSAAVKAVLEAAQVKFWSERGFAPDELASWLEKTNVSQNDYLQGTFANSTIKDIILGTDEGIQLCVDRLSQAGVELFYVDLTRPEIGVPVVRAIAPGLRHFWARLAPGRLYDVPVRLGWLDRAYREQELNPIPCMI
jgi:thiazole/oxazole-forming peptide maturase SagD family component